MNVIFSNQCREFYARYGYLSFYGEYNSLNQLTKETTPAGEILYRYDTDGSLTKEETAGTISRKTWYVTDNRTGYTQTVLELDEEKKVKAAYERGDSLLTARTEEGTKTYITDGHGNLHQHGQLPGEQLRPRKPAQVHLCPEQPPDVQ